MAREQSRRRSPNAVATSRAPAVSSAAPVAKPRDWRVLPGYALLLVVPFAIYLPAMQGEFIWDDRKIYIVENPLLREADGLWRFWFTTEAVDYYPLTYTTFWIEWRLWGESTLGYHILNVLFHALTALAAWRLLARLQIAGAWLAAWLFVIHPVNVESVAWISQRKSVLAGLFGFVALWAYVRADDDRRRLAFRVLSVVAFLLSLAAKPTLVTLPLVLLAYEAWRSHGLGWSSISRTLPYFGLSVVFGLVGTWFQSHNVLGDQIVREQNLFERIITAGAAAWFYLSKIIWPLNLSFVYERWSSEITPTAIMANVTWLVILAVAWYYRRSWGLPVLAGLGFFLITLVPALGIIDVYFWRYSFVGDHYQYQSMIGVLALITWRATNVVKRCKLSDRAPTLLAAAVSLLLLIATWRQAGLYASEDLLWPDTIAKNPRAFIAYNNLGTRLQARGKLDEAEKQFRAGLAAKSDEPELLGSLALLLARQGRHDEAEKLFSRAGELATPPGEVFVGHAQLLFDRGRFAEALAVLDRAERRPAEARTAALAQYYAGLCHEQLKKPGEAIEHLRAAIELNPGLTLAYSALAQLYERQGNLGAALQTYQRAVEKMPEDADARNAFGRALAMAGRTDSAKAQLQAALRLRNDFGDAHSNLGAIFAQEGRFAPAIEHFETAARIAPQDAVVRVNIGRALAQQGSIRQAAAQFERAIELDPAFVEARAHLAWMLATRGSPSQAEQAVAQAEEALRLSTAGDPQLLDIAAAAYAAAGRFDEAIATAEQALEAAKKTGDPNLIPAIGARLNGYRQGQPYRTTSGN